MKEGKAKKGISSELTSYGEQWTENSLCRPKINLGTRVEDITLLQNGTNLY